MNGNREDQVYLASERTLLAWVRTSLAVMGFGFVVARFNLYLGLISETPPSDWNRWLSTTLGISFVCVGVIANVVAVAQHARYSRSLSPDERPKRLWLNFSLLFALALATLGAMLAASLIVSLRGGH